jgi:mannose-1-phosphate guanylyltransferase/mannose-1-phosphate guanylyltransferase/mannose-6-phosphate isomerase
VVAVGVKDLIVIATGDAVLIVPRGESQRVKEAVEALKAKGLG